MNFDAFDKWYYSLNLWAKFLLICVAFIATFLIVAFSDWMGDKYQEWELLQWAKRQGGPKKPKMIDHFEPRNK